MYISHTNRFRPISSLLMTILVCLISLPAYSGLLDKAKELTNKLPEGTTESITSKGSGLTAGEIASGLKDALKVGTGSVVSQVGQEGGYSNDPDIHIPLPKSLKTAQSVLDKVGKGSMLNDLENRLNSAAEIAAPKAKQLFLDAIAAMTLADAKEIYNGPDDAATQYFQKQMSPALADEMRPVVESSLAEAGAIQSYDNAIAEYKDIPLVPDVKANLSDYVVEKGMDGIFHYLAIEEAKIRNNPAERTTALLQKVFGAK